LHRGSSFLTSLPAKAYTYPVEPGPSQTVRHQEKQEFAVHIKQTLDLMPGTVKMAALAPLRAARAKRLVRTENRAISTNRDKTIGNLRIIQDLLQSWH